MRSLLSSVHNRQLRLVEYLNRHKNGASIDTLTELLDCSERLLREDITDMNKNSDCLTIVSEKRYVYIEYDNSKNIDSVIQYMFDNTSAFKIIELLFNNENLMTADLAKLCGMSTSTIYRTINKINNVLEDYYGISVVQNPYRFKGDEREIRNFYTHYFIEKYPAYLWPFPALGELKFEAFFKDIFKNPISNFSFSELRFIKISAAVSYMRYMNGHNVNFDNMQMNEYFIEKINSMPPEVKRQHEKFLRIEVNIDVIRQLFYPFVVENFYASFKDLYDGVSVNPVARISVNSIEILIARLTNEFNITPPNVERMVIGLHTICYLGKSSNHRTYIIRQQSSRLIDIMEKLNPEFLRRTVEEVENYMLEVWEIDNKEAVNNVVFTLIASWQNLYRELQQRKRPVTVLIASFTGSFHAEMIKEYLNYEFNDKLSIDIYDGSHFRIDEIKALGYDICITDFSVENTDNQRYVCFSDIPSSDDISLIRNMIEEIQNEDKVN